VATIYFLRHGQSEANIHNVYAVDDTPLTATGRVQAADAIMVPDLPSFDRLITSDLARARETAEMIAPVLGLAIELDPRLREVNVGLMKGQPDKHMVGYYDAANTPGNPLEVELPTEAITRLSAFLDTLKDSEESILLVGHSGSGMLLRQLITHEEVALVARDNLVNGQIVKFGEIS